MTTIQHKIGDSINWSVVLKNDLTGTPINLTGGTVTVQFRSLSGGSLITPVVTLSNQGTNPGEFTVVVADGEVFRTAPAVLYADFQFVQAGLTQSSEIFKIELQRDVTI